MVRAGARNVEEAEQVLELAVTYGAIPPDQAERIVVVPFDIEDESTFVEALGDANKVRTLTTRVASEQGMHDLDEWVETLNGSL